MPRTTVDIEPPILEEIRTLQKKLGLPLGAIVSRLLADALGRLAWVSKRMTPRVDLADKEAVYAALDRGV